MAALHGRGADRTVCLTGPESTGKTTLAHALGERFGAPVVAEVAREYLLGREQYAAEDVLEIARRQLAHEAELRAATRGLLICDTDVLVLAVWWEEKFGELPALIADALGRRGQRSYLLTRPDLAWEADPQRENPHDRERLFRRYLELLESSSSEYRVIEGEGVVRLERAVAAVAALTGS